MSFRTERYERDPESLTGYLHLMNRYFYVYILSNKLRTVFYTGVTNNLERRIFEHTTHQNTGFTEKYKCTDLMYYETYPKALEAIHREKQLKNWKREWKVKLIQEVNPLLKDLSQRVSLFEIPGQARNDE